MIRSSLIALAVTFVSAVGLGFLDWRIGSSSPSGFILPMGLGAFTFFILQMMSGNRKEVRVDDASRQSSLNAAIPAGPRMKT